MANDATDRLLGEIGRLLAEDAEYPPDGTLLYARLASNMVAPSILKNRWNSIVYRDPDLDRLGDALLDLWETEEPENRWAEIEYLVSGDTFEVAYTYADEIVQDEDTFERRDRIVKRYLGTSPSSTHLNRRRIAPPLASISRLATATAARKPLDRSSPVF